MDWLDGGEDLLTAQREFDPICGHFKRNTQILGLIRIGFSLGKRTGVTITMLGSPARPDKPKLLDQV